MFPDLPDILTEPQTEWNETITASDLGTNQNDSSLYDDARITRVESAVAIISFIQSEHLSGAGTARLLSLIGLHLPEKNNFFKTSNELFGVLGNNDMPPNIFHFCSLCLKSRASSSDLCDSCSSDKKTIHYFIQFPLEPQIKKMYMRPGFLEDIQYKKTRVKVDRDNYEDVYDGKCYQEAEKDFLADSNNISFMWNTDGVQVFVSSLMSMWVYYLIINELPPHKRFLTENMLIAGIWCSSAKPHPNIFLQPIYNDLQTLQNGIFVKFFNDFTEHKVICKLLCGTMDSPARSTFLNMKSHSGFYSCFMCLCKGVKNKESGGVTVFPFEENFPQRTLEEYCDHVKYAVENRVVYNKALLNDDQCCGIKGPTLLFYMLCNMFLSTAIDPMHCVYLGVMRQMLNLMTSSDYSEEPFSVYDKISTINSRIKKVKVPHFVERLPQGVDKLVHWKASELRNFMFYICLLVFNGVLKPEYFDHLKLFVRGVALLNKSSVSKDDIRESNNLLREFVKKFQILYGLRHMSYNLHLLLHLPSCVEQLGVLWAIGCFWFEDMNGRVLNLIHGTRHIGLQVCTNLAVLTGLPLLVHKLKNESVRRFCLQMRYKWLNVKISEKICERVFCVGNLYPIGDDNLWIVRELVQSHVVSDPEECSISIFHRLLKKRILFTSASYKQCVSVSSYVQYNFANTTLYGNIQAFVKIQEVSGDVHFYAVVNRFQETEAFETQHLLQVRPPHVQTDIVHVNDVVMVLFMGDFKEGTYISVPLNNFELE